MNAGTDPLTTKSEVWLYKLLLYIHSPLTAEVIPQSLQH
jgi:hypothetical protein